MNYEDVKKFNYNVSKITERTLSSIGNLIFEIHPYEKRFSIKDKTGKIIEIFDKEEDALELLGILNSKYQEAVCLIINAARDDFMDFTKGLT